MAIERHVISLEARDQISPALKKVATNAQDAGRKAEDAGRRATRATQDWGEASRKVGAALGTLAGVAIKMGNDSEVVQRRLEQSIENTGAAYADLEEQIGKAADRSLDLAFDDEDALNAIARLTDATGSATEAIDSLAIAQDVARGRGISLAQATELVVKASQGQYGQLKRLGIVIDENATKEEALAALQAKYAGQAEAYASTNAATWDRIGNTVENKLETIGGALADFQTPLALIGSAGLALDPLADAFDAIGGKAKLASVASNVLSSAWIGPAGLAIGAGAAAVAVWKLVDSQEDNTLSTSELTGMIEANTQSILDNAAAYERLGLFVEADAVGKAFNVMITQGDQAQDTLNNITDAINELNNSGGVTALDVDVFGALSEADAAWIDSVFGNGDAMLDMQELTAAQDYYTNSLRLTEAQANKVGTAFDQAMTWARDPNYFGSEIIEDINEILNNPNLTGEEVVAAFEAIIAKQEEYSRVARRAKEAQDEANKTLHTGWGVYGEVIGRVEDYIGAKEREARAVRDAAGAELEGQAAANNDAIQGRIEQSKQNYENYQVALDALTGSTVGFATETEGAGASVDAFSARLDSEAIPAARALNDELDALAASLASMPADILEDTFQAIVGSTNGMVGSINTAREWADALIAPVGTYSAIDDLLAKGKISLEDYTQAQQAQVDITEDYNRALTASQTIQAMQAPLIAKQADATADYLENLAGLTEEEQMLALAWADADYAGRANDIANMAANYGEMDEAQKAAFENMVTQAAAADPVLAGLLEQLGIIELGANGEVVLDVDEGKSAVGMLNDSIDELILRLDPTYIAKMDTEDMGATARAGLYAELFAYGLSSYTTKLDADPAPFWSEVNAIPDTVATRYVDVYYRGVGPSPYALGGIVPDLEAAALGRLSGGNLTLVGEHGPELVSLPGGSMVTPNHATRYREEAKRGGGDIVFAGPVTIVANNPEDFYRKARALATSLERR